MTAKTTAVWRQYLHSAPGKGSRSDQVARSAMAMATRATTPIAAATIADVPARLAIASRIRVARRIATAVTSSTFGRAGRVAESAAGGA
jgi:hypothetical protein